MDFMMRMGFKNLSVENTNEQMNTRLDDRLFTEIFYGDQRPDNPSALLGYGHVVLNNLFNLFKPEFLTYEMQVIMEYTSWGCCKIK